MAASEDVTMQESSSSSSENGEFQLSAALGGHENPVRCVCSSGSDSNTIVTAETNGFMRVWKRVGSSPDSTEFESRAVFDQPVHGNKNLCFALEFLPDKFGYGRGTFISGGNDKAARLWDISEKVHPALLGHSGPVNAVAVANNGDIITGSYDKTAKVWRGGQCVHTLPGHEYGVEVCGLGSGEVVTGSDRHLHLWRDGAKVKTIADAHQHVIRRIVNHPLGFATASNDGFVKVWSNAGELLVSIHAHQGVGETPPFVYGVASLGDGSLVSVGEDKTARVWNADGSSKQVVKLPAVARAVCALPNGDFAVACTDNTARVFSAAAGRQADAGTLKQFDEHAQLAHASNVEDIDTSNMSGPEALAVAGTKPGEIKMIVDPAKGSTPTVYQWDASATAWVEIGSAIGRKAAKPNIDGVEYDAVTEVVMDQTGAKLKLGINRHDDPYQVAKAFCTRHSLDWGDFQKPLVDHLTPLTDPKARQAKLARDREAQLAQLRQVGRPGQFETFIPCKASAMGDRLRETNRGLQDSNHQHALRYDTELAALDSVLGGIAQPGKFHSLVLSESAVEAVGKMLQWPADQALPVLDLVRVLLITGAVQQISPDRNAEIAAGILRLASDPASGDKHRMLTARILANFVAKRIRTGDGSGVPQKTIDWLVEVLSAIAECTGDQNKNVVSSYVMALYNVMLWFHKFRVLDCDLYMLVASALFEVLAQPKSDKLLFYGLLTIGNCAHASDNARDMICEVFAEQIQALVNQVAQKQNPAMQELADDFRKIFRGTIH